MMATNKMLELLGALKSGTEAHRVTWQDLPEEDMFRAHIGVGMVRLGKAETPGTLGYKLWLMAPGGAIVGELEVNRGEPAYDLIEDVYMSARLAARGGEQLLDQMIQLLQPVHR
jgi:hypothetical protein